MSSNARNLVEDGNKKPTTSILSKAYGWMYEGFTAAPAYGKIVYSIARQIGWFVITTGMITLLPLVFEVRREAALEDFERAQIAAGLQEGKTPQELHAMGLTGAVEPRVLN